MEENLAYSWQELNLNQPINQLIAKDLQPLYLAFVTSFSHKIRNQGMIEGCCRDPC
jgi:hypothetical protein